MKEYLLSIDMAKELSMLERNEKGKQARIYFIECEKRLREQSLNYYSIEVSPERIAERRKILQKQFLIHAEKEENASYYSAPMRVRKKKRYPKNRVTLPNF